MFSTQISSIENQIQELTAKLDQYRALENEMQSALDAIARIKESAQALGVQDEVSQQFVEAVGLKQEADVQPVVEERITEAEIQPVVGSPTQEPVPGPGEVDGEEPTSVEATTANRYESAAEIAAALADKDEVDAHLMAIASILDSCPVVEISGRVWFFVQNIPGELDERILGYLPKPIRPEWDKQRTLWEEEARASIFPKTIDSQLLNTKESAPQADSDWVNLVEDDEEEGLFKRETQEWGEDLDDEDDRQTNIFDAIESVKSSEVEAKSFEVDDLVQLPDGRVCRVENLITSGSSKLATVIMPDGGKGSFHCSTLKYFGKFQPAYKKGDYVELYDGAICEVLQAAQVGDSFYIEVHHEGAKQAYRPSDLKPATKPETASTTVCGSIEQPKAAKSRKLKTKAATSADILKCKSWEEIRAIAQPKPELLREAAISAKTQSEKQLIEKLPEMIRQWQMDNRDFSDFDWMPAYLTQRVRSLLSAPSTAA